MPADDADAMIDHEIIVAERDAALRAVFGELPQNCRELLSMLISDQPRNYADISATLGIAIGSIGPTRARCLDRLRRSPHLTTFLGDSASVINVKESVR